jgi:hypothetical protein
VGEIEMNANPNRKSHQDEYNRSKRARKVFRGMLILSGGYDAARAETAENWARLGV